MEIHSNYPAIPPKNQDIQSSVLYITIISGPVWNVLNATSAKWVCTTFTAVPKILVKISLHSTYILILLDQRHGVVIEIQKATFHKAEPTIHLIKAGKFVKWMCIMVMTFVHNWDFSKIKKNCRRPYRNWHVWGCIVCFYNVFLFYW